MRADITCLVVDGIVNAANSSLLGGGGVDGAIHRAAGPELLMACRKLAGCLPGQVKVTPGFQLPAQYVLHAVGPIWRGGDSGEAELLASCYDQSLALASSLGLQSLAFPAISCGVYGYPHPQAVSIAVNRVCLGLERQTSLLQVVFCCFDGAMLELYRHELAGKYGGQD